MCRFCLLVFGVIFLTAVFFACDQPSAPTTTDKTTQDEEEEEGRSADRIKESVIARTAHGYTLLQEFKLNEAAGHTIKETHQHPRVENRVVYHLSVDPDKAAHEASIFTSAGTIYMIAWSYPLDESEAEKLIEEAKTTYADYFVEERDAKGGSFWIFRDKETEYEISFGIGGFGSSLKDIKLSEKVYNEEFNN